MTANLRFPLSPDLSISMDDGHVDHDHDETFREHSHLSTALQKYHNLAKNIEKNQTHHLFYQVVLWERFKMFYENIGFAVKMAVVHYMSGKF